jgi:hypothetical protein
MDKRERVKALRQGYVDGRSDQAFTDPLGFDDRSQEWEAAARRRYPMPKKVVPRKVPWPESNGAIYLDSTGRIKHTDPRQTSIIWYTEAETAALRDLLTGPETIEVEDDS